MTAALFAIGFIVLVLSLIAWALDGVDRSWVRLAGIALGIATCFGAVLLS